MTKAKHMPVAPPLPGGSIDFNKLHHAALAGTDADKAVAAARITPDREKPAPRAETRAPVMTAMKEDSTNG